MLKSVVVVVLVVEVFVVVGLFVVVVAGEWLMMMDCIDRVVVFVLEIGRCCCR